MRELRGEGKGVYVCVVVAMGRVNAFGARLKGWVKRFLFLT